VCYAGDSAARALLGKLLRAGCKPYFQTLERWLCEGILDDPFCEFMVQENVVGALAIRIWKICAYSLSLRMAMGLLFIMKVLLVVFLSLTLLTVLLVRVLQAFFSAQYLIITMITSSFHGWHGLSSLSHCN
jgi:hypothetical protein